MTKLEQLLQSAASDLNRHVRSEVPLPGFEFVRPPRRVRNMALAVATAVAVGVSFIALALVAPFGQETPVADEPIGPPGSTSAPTSAPAPAVPTYVWTRVDDPDLGGEGNQTIYSIRGVSSGLIAVGEDQYSPAVWTSDDGLDWHRITDETGAFGMEPSPYGEDSRRWLLDVAEGDGRLVAVGIDVLHRPGESHVEIDPAVKVMVFWYSDDGSTWTRVPDDGGIFRLGSGPLRSDVRVIATSSGFLAVGEAIWTSPDGASWTRTDVPDGYVSGALTTGSTILAVGAVGPNDEWESREAAWYSTDGGAWMSAGVETSPSIQGRFVAIAETSDGYLALGSGSRRLAPGRRPAAGFPGVGNQLPTSLADREHTEAGVVDNGVTHRVARIDAGWPATQ